MECQFSIYLFSQLLSEPLNSNKGCEWAELREERSLTLNKVSRQGVCYNQYTNPDDIHPQNKQDVGYRLSRIALNSIYNKPMVNSGPVFNPMKIKANSVIVVSII